MFYKLMNI